MRPCTGGGIEPKENVGGEQSTEEHDFRCEKKPDTDFRVPEPGIGAGSDGIGNFHFSLSWRLMHCGGGFVRFAVALAHRFALHRKVVLAAGEAVFVGSAINRWRGGKVPMRRR